MPTQSASTTPVGGPRRRPGACSPVPFPVPVQDPGARLQRPLRGVRPERARSLQVGAAEPSSAGETRCDAGQRSKSCSVAAGTPDTSLGCCSRATEVRPVAGLAHLPLLHRSRASRVASAVDRPPVANLGPATGDPGDDVVVLRVLRL